MVTPKSPFLCKKYKKQPKTSQKGSFSAVFWSKWRDSNSRPPVPETGALPTALHLVLMIFMRFSVSGQTCGQTENLRTFKTSGEPKKSVFSRGLGVFQNFRFEIGGLHPKLARYQLRYTSKCWFCGMGYADALLATLGAYTSILWVSRTTHALQYIKFARVCQGLLTDLFCFLLAGGVRFGSAGEPRCRRWRWAR